MVKILGFTFGSLFMYVHYADAQGDAYHRPLSIFRDFEPVWIGYALFVLLLMICLQAAWTAYRAQSEGHTLAYLAATGLLGVVAATPSDDELHTMCAIFAMVGIFIYYSAILYAADSLFWLVMHLLSPSFLMMATRIESYGIWQKGMIAYFLIATIVHEGVLARELPTPVRPRPKKVKVAIGRRQAAYRK
jgi:hypothetical protein